MNDEHCRDLTVEYSLLERKRDVLCRNFGVENTLVRMWSLQPPTLGEHVTTKVKIYRLDRRRAIILCFLSIDTISLLCLNTYLHYITPTPNHYVVYRDSILSVLRQSC